MMKKIRNMKREIAFLLMCCMILVHLSGCVAKPVQAANLMEGVVAGNVTGKTPDNSFINAQMKFSTELFQATVLASEGKNVLISPLSVALALAMTANGADGKTKEEMEAVLADGMSIDMLNEYLYGYVHALPSMEKCKLQIADSIWFRDDSSLVVEPDFLQKNADYYGAAAYKSAFDDDTLSAINNWVKQNTDGMIDKILDGIDPDTVMYLINALVFDAEWQTVYELNDIYSSSFHAVNGEIRTVEMMRSWEGLYLETEKATGFIKNYKDGKYGFVALLPNEDISISDYIAGLTPESLYQTVTDVQKCGVMVHIPKFSYEYELSMKEILQELGMTSAFESAADLSKLGHSSYGNLYIGDVFHKTFISVDELGTKAGAVTRVDIDAESAMEGPQKEVKLDRPFVYFIIDNSTSLPVFMGVVADIEK